VSVRLQHQQAGAGGGHKGWGCVPVGPFQPCSPRQDLHHASECWHAPVPCLRWHQCHLVWYQPEHAGALGHDVSHLPAFQSASNLSDLGTYEAFGCHGSKPKMSEQSFSQAHTCQARMPSMHAMHVCACEKLCSDSQSLTRLQMTALSASEFDVPELTLLVARAKQQSMCILPSRS